MEDAGYRPFPNSRRRNFLQRRLEVPLFIRALGLGAGGRILEVGCGRGVALPVFESMLRPQLIVGLDLDGTFLTEAKAGSGPESRACLAQGDIECLPFADESFDLVIDFGTCYHVAATEAALTCEPVATEATRKVPMCPASSAALVEIRSWYGWIVSQKGRRCSRPSI